MSQDPHVIGLDVCITDTITCIQDLIKIMQQHCNTTMKKELEVVKDKLFEIQFTLNDEFDGS